MSATTPREVSARLVAGSSADFVRTIVSGRTPAVFRGLADAWPAVTKWTSDHFASVFPDLQLPVEVWDGSSDGEGLYRTRKIVRMRAADYVDALKRPPSGGGIQYLPEFPIFDHVPTLADDVGPVSPFMDFPGPLPEVVRRKLTRSAYLWWGPAGTVTPLHYDFPQNLLFQIRGTKRVAMFAPEDAANVYSMRENPRVSPVDVERPDASRFPLFAKAKRHDFTITAGDVLFIPFGWWHVVWAVEPSMSLNYWWRTPRSLASEWRTRAQVARDRAREGDIVQLIRSRGFKAKLKRPDLET